MKKADYKALNSSTWQFTESYLGENVYCYLMTGKEKALLIDTAYGFTDLKAAIEELTDKPLLVVNTHGHFDHTSGNYRFEKTFLNVKDREVYERHSHRKTIEDILGSVVGNGFLRKVLILLLRPSLSKIYSHPFPDTEPLPECGYFELGERRVRIIETPGHTLGSISLLDEKNGWLMSGDTCGDVGMLLHFPEGSSVRTFHNTIRKIRNLVDNGEVRRNYPAHQTSPAPLEKLENYDLLLDRMENGDLSENEWRKHLAEGDGIKIQFDAKRVREEVKENQTNNKTI